MVLSFQSNGIIVVCPGGSISSFGLRPPRPAEHKVTGTGSTPFASESLEVVMSGAPPPFLPLIPGPVNPGWTLYGH